MKRKPKQILHQPLDTLSDAQTEIRWQALCDHYGIRFGAHDWRTSLLCALASDRWTGFRAAKNKRGKPRKVSNRILLLYVGASVFGGQSPGSAQKVGTVANCARLDKLIADLHREFLLNRKKVSQAWLAKRLCEHKLSPWRGQNVETLRFVIRKIGKNPDALADWQPATAAEMRASLRTIVKVSGDEHPFWIPPTFEELHGDVFDDEVAD